MKFEPELRETEEGIEIRLNYQAPESGKSFSFYVFAANGITQKEGAEKLGKWIKRFHVGKDNNQAILCHLFSEGLIRYWRCNLMLSNYCQSVF